MAKLKDSDTLTEGVRVRAIAQYIPAQSDPEKKRYFFAYRVTISNESESEVKLLSRHWIIIDSDGSRTDVQGPGVVGEQPTLEPGKSFTYTSFCPLPTDFGTMEGFYQMRREDGYEFQAEVGRFFLAANAEIEENVVF
ncbi:MAG: Co2+/Mg2+ efflux protein ApaG [Leptospiraceae bacterium]|nr:Co2+/Mg2+ efflux protein ApaG [Leptospiraceae bacterium]MCB1200305.1 Co2+/Mg2+ efflux protein ApaG [Leptospiraceae bacterium]